MILWDRDYGINEQERLALLVQRYHNLSVNDEVAVELWSHRWLSSSSSRILTYFDAFEDDGVTNFHEGTHIDAPGGVLGGSRCLYHG
mmetsp:Transcript_12288/g.17650  ORF Transcript_12288/g.17650 Transcript_12288/m.17650 type:complete len:87 (-) Transcript_12288:42-302(-)